MHHLPDDVVLFCLTFCNARELAQLARVNKYFQKATIDAVVQILRQLERKYNRRIEPELPYEYPGLIGYLYRICKPKLFLAGGGSIMDGDESYKRTDVFDADR
jgi:hypothetical protein